MRRTTASLVLLPVVALVAWVIVVTAAYGSFSGAPGPVVVIGFYLLPVIYLSYAFGYALARAMRHAVPGSAIVAICCAALAICGWRIPAFLHGVNGSDRAREGHIAVWLLLLAVPAVGGLVASVPHGWSRAHRQGELLNDAR